MILVRGRLKTSPKQVMQNKQVLQGSVSVSYLSPMSIEESSKREDEDSGGLGPGRSEQTDGGR
jgi:hypothetical protein